MAVEYDDSDVQALSEELQHRDLRPDDAHRLTAKAISEHAPVVCDVPTEDAQHMLRRLHMTAHELSMVTGVPLSSIENFVSGQSKGNDQLLGPILKRAATVAAKLSKQN